MKAAKVRYIGTRDAVDGAQVWLRFPGGREERLPLRTEVECRSPTGFEWGYHGSGPRQLAIALAVDALERAGVSKERAAAEAVKVSNRLKCVLVAQLRREGWEMDHADVLMLVQDAGKE